MTDSALQTHSAQISLSRVIDWLRVHRWATLLTAWVLVRLLANALFVLGIPPLESHVGFYFHHGGDQDYYFQYAVALVEGPLDYFSINIGAPAVMAVFVRLADAASYDDILTPMVLLNGFLLGGLSVAVLGALARRVFQSERLGLLTAGLWATASWSLYALFGLHPQAPWVRAPYVPGLAWLNMNSDGPAIFFTLLGALLLWRFRDSSKRRYALLGGMAFGAALLFRAVMAVPIALIFLSVMTEPRRWFAGLLATLGGLIAYLPQVVYNQLAASFKGMWYVNPFLPGYLYFGYLNLGVEGDGPRNIPVEWKPVAFAHLIESFQKFVVGRELLLALAILATCLALFPFIDLWKKRGVRAALFTFMTGPLIIALAAASLGFTVDPFRFSMPAFPFLLLAAVWTLAWAGERLRPLLARFIVRLAARS